jgi:restriction system protein
MADFVKKRIIAVGWPNTGDLTGLDREGLAARLKEAYPDHDGGWYSTGVATLLRFRDEMQIGDLVVVAPRTSDSPNVSVARLAGPYRFDADTDGEYFGYPHHRPVTWLRHEVPRQALPGEVISSLHSHETLFRTNRDAMVAWANREGLLGPSGQ